jgi:hypothetical protein
MQTLDGQIASRILEIREAGNRIASVSHEANELAHVRWQWHTGWVRTRPLPAMGGEGNAVLEMRRGSVAGLEAQLDLAIAGDMPPVRLHLRIHGHDIGTTMRPAGETDDREMAAVLAAFRDEAVPHLARLLRIPEPLVRYFAARGSARVRRCGRGERHLVELEGNLAGAQRTLCVLYEHAVRGTSRVALADGPAITQRLESWIGCAMPLAAQIVKMPLV